MCHRQRFVCLEAGIEFPADEFLDNGRRLDVSPPDPHIRPTGIYKHVDHRGNQFGIPVVKVSQISSSSMLQAVKTYDSFPLG